MQSPTAPVSPAVSPGGAGGLRAALSEPRMAQLAFEDVPQALRLIHGAVEWGCRAHYGPRQRQAVFAAYASTLFVESQGAFETIAVHQEGELRGVAQLDPSDQRLRALFVAAGSQRRGVGRALLVEVEARALAGGCTRLHGAMALNAVNFYRRLGFEACSAPEPLGSQGTFIPIVRMEKILRR